MLTELLMRFRRTYIARKCGHETRRKGSLFAFGTRRPIKLALNDAGGVDWCFTCLSHMTIKCAWCDRPIFIGDYVTLYSPHPTHGRVLPLWDAVSGPDGGFVGCTHPWCCHTYADIGGVWQPGENGKGRVQEIPSMYEEALKKNFALRNF